mmetsp:Transcript_11184/g.22664  ORF Transcript_11184/g.22664 Transcript_11184/m.22664 type:complete len:148 (-) Transcript_11184:38-481(-)
MPWSRTAAHLLKLSHPERFLGAQFGFSQRTILRYASAHPKFRCDAMLVDGSKSQHGRASDIDNLRKLSHQGARLYLDEVSSERCINGSIVDNDQWRTECKLRTARIKTWIGDAPRAYHEAAVRGLIRVRGCAFGGEQDGICEAEYAS